MLTRVRGTVKAHYRVLGYDLVRVGKGNDDGFERQAFCFGRRAELVHNFIVILASGYGFIAVLGSRFISQSTSLEGSAD